ncbi:hypothetical protein D1007_57410 [Hordeum vulgare]|nr:hypothetical protein D1007_57410 [Hordeum vulgare]
MLPMDADIVRKIPLSHTAQTDFYAWHYEKSGLFMVRSCYRMVVATKLRRERWLNGDAEASDTDRQEANWKKLWGTKVPAKLRLFAWRLARASLPTGQERGRRQMTVDTSCPICQGAEDSWRHALLDCNMARSVWSLCADDDDSLLPAYGDETQDPKLWLHGMCNTLTSERFIAILTTLWAIWWARRKAIHEKEFQSPLSTHLFIERYLNELRGLPSMQKSTTRRIDVLPAPRWIPPSAGEAKLNVDGAVAKSSNIGAVGVICRDAQGHFMGASTIVLMGVIDPAVVEAHARREVIALAEDLMIPNIRIASDCLRVIKDLQIQDQRGEYCMILQDIQKSKSSFNSCTFVFERRDSNSEAHKIARMATTLGLGRHLWLQRPPGNLCIPQDIMS